MTETIHQILGIIGIIAGIAFPVMLIVLLANLKKRQTDPKGFRQIVTAVIAVTLLNAGTNIAYFAMSVQKFSRFDTGQLEVMELTSADLHDGVWDTRITKTDAGENLSPQLQWDPVEGAACYAVYMVDESADHWLHWKQMGFTETELPSGFAPGACYIGPYPPEGTHVYMVYVLALRSDRCGNLGRLDAPNADVTEMLQSLDVKEDGSTGNVIAYGYLTGTYSAQN